LAILPEEGGPGQSRRIKVSFKVFFALRDRVRRQGVDYDTLYVPGCAALAGEGLPAVPVKSLFLALPEHPNVKIETRIIENVCLKDLFILPVQPPPMESLPDRKAPFLRDEQVYGRDEFFPANLLLQSRIVGMRDKQLLEIRFTPVQFNPMRRMVSFATHIELLIDTQADSDP
jgi:hypothetical protein